MKFTLTFDGSLPATGNSSRKVQKKWEIRKHFDPQLRELWSIHPALVEFRANRSTVPASGYWLLERHHTISSPSFKPPHDDDIDLCAPILRGGRTFNPLVRESLALMCGLKILFLRKETPGKVYQGGDLDNRLKTLIDALCVPPHDEQVIQNDFAVNDPIFCLLEDDALISGISVETERLLTQPAADVTDVRLIIEVDVRVSQARLYNSIFLGS